MTLNSVLKGNESCIGAFFYFCLLRMLTKHSFFLFYRNNFKLGFGRDSKAKINTRVEENLGEFCVDNGILFCNFCDYSLTRCETLNILHFNGNLNI